MQKSIRTFEDLRERCTVLPDGCWRFNGRHGKDGQPAVCIPGYSGAVSVQTLLAVLSTGQELPDGRKFKPTCGNAWCLNQDHRKECSDTDFRKDCRSRAKIKPQIQRKPQIDKRAQTARQTYADAPAIVTRQTKKTVCPSPKPITLPAGYISQIDPAQCRPWAVAAVGGCA